MCAILSGEAGPVWALHTTPQAAVVLSRYPRCWGQAMVLLRRHVTCYGEVHEAEWLEACALARRAAVQIEQHLSPVRCYISSLGAARTDLPMSAAHLHIHIDPVYSLDDRPRTILTLEHGVLAASPEEWAALQARLRW